MPNINIVKALDTLMLNVDILWIFQGEGSVGNSRILILLLITFYMSVY